MGLDIRGAVYGDFSHLVGQSIQYEGVVERLYVGDIWEEDMVTPDGAFLDVYVEIGERLVCVGMLDLFGHGWTLESVRQVTDWIEKNGFSSVCESIVLGGE